jgi:dUTPase
MNISYYLPDHLPNLEQAYGATSAGFDLHAAAYTLLDRNIEVVCNGEDRRTGLDFSKRPLIGTGLRIDLPDPSHYAEIRERGSIRKYPLALRAGIIDFGYTGEIFVQADVYDSVCFNGGEVLPFQIIFHPCCAVSSHLHRVSLEEFERISSRHQRQAGALGSSNKI